MEYKDLDDAQLKLADDGAGVVAGYASVFNNVDGQGERVMPGAFKKYLPEFLAHGFIAVGHDWTAPPIATPMEAREDDHGLFVKAAFHSTPEAQSVRTIIAERLARGKSVRLSIGYEVMDAKPNQGVRDLTELKLHEWSYVTVPANPLARVTYAKHMPLAEQSDAALALVKDYSERLKSLHDLLAKEGRPISSARRRRMVDWKSTLQMLIEDLDALLAETDAEGKPEKTVVNIAEIDTLFQEMQSLSAKLRI